MRIDATVLRVNPRNLLVRDLGNRQEILVHFRNTAGFRPGDRVRIEFNGQMTRSIPPQITAAAIRRMEGPGLPGQPAPGETRATVLQRRGSSLLVRDAGSNRQLVVHTPHANHFCVGQRIVVRHDRIVMSNPPEVNAIEITTIC